MIEIAATVEDDLLHAGLDCAAGNELAHRGGGRDVVALLLARLHAFAGIRGGDGAALRVIDELRVDVLARTVDRKARTSAARLRDAITRAPRAPFEQFLLVGHKRSSPLFLLAFFAADTFARVAHALALVRLRRTIAADFGRDLTHELLVAAADRNRCRLLADDLDTGRDRIEHVVREPDLQLQVLALHGRTITDARDLKTLRIALGDAR